jgi:CRISPR-associated protein Csm4
MKRLKMKLIKVKITPHSSFVTFPKGDTIFGHFAYYSFLQGEEHFKHYIDEEEPKIIFSDILPDGYLYKPTLPLSAFGVDESEKKEFRKKSWIAIEPFKRGELLKAKELSFYKREVRVRNSLNRVTFSTGGEGFDPFSLEEMTFIYQPVIYVLFDENSFSKESIEERLNLIGQNGFGKKGSIGKGHFSAKVEEEFKEFDEVESDYYLTLSPTILNKQPNIEKAYYNTFNRFGKSHGSSTPFKKPLLMADSGAVIKLEEKRAYIGRGIDNGIGNQSLVQGYSIVVPFKFEGLKDG